ncbi:MAG TPA: sensor histidine kinase [Kofleriaceae bacterium]|jgi:signal transduction histidine kinase|nr:sensor histidine kinase [Kofleriaceae bacterium]
MIGERARVTTSLRWRVLLVLSLAAMVPTVIVGALAIMRARDDVEREVDRSALAHIRALGAVLDNTLQDARRTVELAAASWADAPDDARQPHLLLDRLRNDLPIVHTLAILDPEGRRKFGDPVPANLDIGSHSLGGYIGNAEYVDGRPVVHLVLQARGRTGELIGLFVAGLDLGFVRDELADARLGHGARVIVVDSTGVVVAAHDEGHGPADHAWAHGPVSLAGKDPAVDRALAATVEGTLAANGVVSAYRNLSSYQSRHGVRWAILHQQRERDAYALARETTRDTLIIGGAALALALALGWFSATRLTRPLAALARHADAIASGSADDPPPVRGPGEIGVLGERIDEMARRIAERAALQSALARGDRLASVGVMSAQVAHEINNPLTTVLGYAKLLQEGKPEGHPDREALELIASEAERMKTIVGGLLEYARVPRKTDRRIAITPAEGVIAICDPAAVLRHVGALLEPQLRRTKATLAIEVTATAPLAIEAHALQQVLVNLAQNAAQAMAAANIEGGTLAIAAKPGPGGIATLITVTDEGPGVPASDRARVFDPFFTTKTADAGTGLGLAVCKHLVTTAGGSIEVGDGPDGRGAEFRVVIPNAS